MRISDWSSDVCSSDLSRRGEVGRSDQACGIVGVIGLGVAERPEQECVLKTALGTKRIEIDPCRGRNRNAAEVAGLRHKRIIRFKDRKSTRLNSITNAHLICRLTIAKKKTSNLIRSN